uniref:Uncharacterized protein n=1 Tax=Anopheles epiroticus TaxID=199890 RepID=A0A182PXP6_9DIPT
MPNTSSSVPFLLSSSMQSIRSRRTSTVLSSGPLGSGSGLLQQLGSGMVRQLTGYGGSGAASPVQQSLFNGNSSSQTRNNYSTVVKQSSKISNLKPLELLSYAPASRNTSATSSFQRSFQKSQKKAIKNLRKSFKL